MDLVLGVRVGGQVFEEQAHPAVPDVHRRVRGVQSGDVGAQLADLSDQGLGLSHRASISADDHSVTRHELTQLVTPSA